MKRALAPLAAGVFDLLVLGGGITGAGIALDAALRGLRVALIDRGDFAGGTSSASSKLVHGGLRYLEHGGFHLVYEALAERRLLLHNAPHLVRPLEFLIPFYAGNRVARWQWRLALTLYDLLAGRGNLARSRPLDQARIGRAFPALRREGLHGGAIYFDAQMDDARLCIEVMRTASLQGACVANYVEAVGFLTDAGRIVGVRAVDRLTGSEFAIRAGQVVNATGPWVDAVCRMAGDIGGPYLQPTKGVHIITPNRVQLGVAMLLLHPVDGRVFFVIPWPRGMDDEHPANHLLIGTTDTFADQPPDALTVTPADIAYLLEGHNHFLQPAMRPGDVEGRFVGLRPLIRSKPGQPSAISREFRLIESPGGLLSVAGGKYTTYRHMAEAATDRVMQLLRRKGRCRTQDFPLDGTPAEPWQRFVADTGTKLQSQYRLTDAAARHLIDRYGKRAFDVASNLTASPELAKPIVAGEPDLAVEMLYQRNHEMALTPEDFFLRRMRLGMYRPEVLDVARKPGIVKQSNS
jgi:glycerol-3-phosphate dehydrogenase